MTKSEVANSYLEHLQNGNIVAVIDLFTHEGIVESPVYGVKKASQFYHELNNDTSKSELEVKGVFEERDSNTIALYFTYHWTLKNKEKVSFDVVDIIEFSSAHKIKKLTIIYDTVISRRLVQELRS